MSLLYFWYACEVGVVSVMVIVLEYMCVVCVQHVLNMFSCLSQGARNIEKKNKEIYNKL